MSPEQLLANLPPNATPEQLLANLPPNATPEQIMAILAVVSAAPAAAALTTFPPAPPPPAAPPYAVPGVATHVPPTLGAAPPAPVDPRPPAEQAPRRRRSRKSDAPAEQAPAPVLDTTCHTGRSATTAATDAPLVAGLLAACATGGVSLVDARAYVQLFRELTEGR
jgi:hypothetical protein